jgi:hypothetical protein
MGKPWFLIALVVCACTSVALLGSSVTAAPIAAADKSLRSELGYAQQPLIEWEDNRNAANGLDIYATVVYHGKSWLPHVMK